MRIGVPRECPAGSIDTLELPDLALHFDTTASWLVFARDLVLVALLAVLSWPHVGPRRTLPVT